jgi:serine/threonine protein kinase
VELDRLVAQRLAAGWDLRSKRAFIARFAQFMARLHSKGIFHSDLKTCNILMNEDPDGADFLLLDYDDVSFFSKLPISKRLKNLTQIFLSSPKAFNVKDRMLWLRIYTENSGLENQRLKVMGRRVINAASGRKILYVTHQGDQEEDWEE